MPSLRDRLKIINQIKNSNNKPEQKVSNVIDIQIPGWQSCGYGVLKKDTIINTKLKIKKSLSARLPAALPVFVPDLEGKKLPNIKDFLFFDLETSGLSGGAGTLAFLAAFGLFLPDGKLKVTQYLLLDYPGENDFLKAVLNEFNDKTKYIVTYNGKCFDSQIIKNRCLMNTVMPPLYNHIDLLHPARRLWKTIIQSCSQKSVEENILGLKRIDDIPGAEAPDIWYNFLKTGKTERLLGICEHNCYDIEGLASILLAILEIASNPVNCKKYVYDKQRLANFWKKYCKRNNDKKLQVLEDKLYCIINAEGAEFRRG